MDWINELVARIKGAAAALGSLKNGLGAAKDAYNEANHALKRIKENLGL